MSGGLIFLIVVALIAVVIIFMVIGMYNNLVALKHRFKNAYSQIDVQLTRRFELIPNLVTTAKAFMQHEQETLEKVIQARNQAHKINIDLGKNPSDPNLMSQMISAEKSLQGSMGGFFALAEKYPDLKSDSTMNNLMEELKSTENKVAFARQHFNDQVMEYNTSLEVFPSNIIAGFFRFQSANLFEVENEKVREAVKVSF